MSEARNTVEANCVVGMHYVLKDSAGQVIDQSPEGEPLAYLHGHGNIVPGLERSLVGAKVGAIKEVKVPPAEGYGELDESLIMDVPRAQLPDSLKPEVGMGLSMQTPDGHTIPVRIKSVHEEHVVLDANHELAGVTLHFEVRIDSVRSATQEELRHGHAHGPGGHHH